MSDVITAPSNEVKHAILNTYINGYMINSTMDHRESHRRYFITIPAPRGAHRTNAYNNPDFAIKEAYHMVRGMMSDIAGVIEREDT